MKHLFLDCSMGAAGDMLSAALFELSEDKEKTLAELNGLGIPGVVYEAIPAERCGITGTHFKVTCGGVEELPEAEHEQATAHAHDHHHVHLTDICQWIDGLNAPEKVRSDAKNVYRMIAQAEGKVHGKEMDHIHFHEVGSLDAVADVVAVSYLMNRLSPERVTASSVRTGFGTVRCAHGVLPVPAPATAILLEGLPVFSGDIGCEMCTPTGAALLRYFVQEFSQMPDMTIEKTGYGMGNRNFEQHPNCVRAILGEQEEDAVELSCNVDDMSPEDIGFAFDALLAGGAVDVWYQSVSMKKNRPGVILSCLCRPEKRDEMVRLMFKHTTTIGIRETLCRRYVLKRQEQTVETEMGAVRIKHSQGYGTDRIKAEYEDLARIARDEDLSIETVRQMLK